MKSQLRSWRDIVVPIAFAFVTVALLVFFCPRVMTTSYTRLAHKGHPWEDNAVVAPEGYDVYKSAEEVQRELDSLCRDEGPYYRVDESIRAEELRLLTDTLPALSASHGIPQQAGTSIVALLDDYYAKGILTDDDYRDMARRRVRGVNVYNDARETRRQDFADMMSVKNVYEDIRLNHPELRLYIQHLHLNEYILPNLTYDRQKTEAAEHDARSRIDSIAGRVQAGETVVDKGQVVSSEVYNKLASLERHLSGGQHTPTDDLLQFLGQFIYISLFVLALIAYFIFYRPWCIDEIYRPLLITLLGVAFPLATYLMVEHQVLQVYILPYCLLPIYIRVFIDARTAAMCHLVCVMLSALALRQPFEFIGLQTAAGLAVIYSLQEFRLRSDLVRAIAIQFVISVIFRFGTDMLRISSLHDILRPEYAYTYIYIAAGSVLLFISHLMLFVVERAFKFTSDVTLLELSSLTNPLLKELSERAPGTFQHSMQVGNLAAEVADEIGARTLLVRTGAWFHDIGKLREPSLFTENQSGAKVKTSALDYVASAQRIIAHVSDGLRLAEQHNLPEEIRAFIRTHHGLSQAKYFYISERNAHPDQDVDPAPFTYPGPNPATREQAILMMADTVEAASRSLPEYTEEAIRALVTRLIDEQAEAGYFRQCDISFRDVETAKQAFTRRLLAINHTRIQYPELK